MLIIGFLAAIALPAIAQSDDDAYHPSAIQSQVDESFSDPLIGSPLEGMTQLTLIEEDDCAEWGECEWYDADGVHYYFWGDDPESLFLAVKSISAKDFEGKPIPALGIGMAREKNLVLANVDAFLGGIEISCDARGCGASLDPGWISLTFDEADQLSEVRFDGYHFS